MIPSLSLTPQSPLRFQSRIPISPKVFRHAQKEAQTEAAHRMDLARRENVPVSGMEQVYQFLGLKNALARLTRNNDVRQFHFSTELPPEGGAVLYTGQDEAEMLLNPGLEKTKLNNPFHHWVQDCRRDGWHLHHLDREESEAKSERSLILAEQA